MRSAIRGDPGESIDAFFSGGEYFKHIEAGWGMQFSFKRSFDEHWLPFLRVGYADGGRALLERSVSAGFARYASDEQGVFGLGFNWGRPNLESFGTCADGQYTLEGYYRWELAERLAITPDFQIINDPALNPDDNFIWVAGLRAR